MGIDPSRDATVTYAVATFPDDATRPIVMRF
jgi:hypothetical protein